MSLFYLIGYIQLLSNDYIRHQTLSIIWILWLDNKIVITCHCPILCFAFYKQKIFCLVYLGQIVLWCKLQVMNSMVEDISITSRSSFESYTSRLLNSMDAICADLVHDECGKIFYHHRSLSMTFSPGHTCLNLQIRKCLAYQASIHRRLTRILGLKGKNPVLIWYDRKLPEVDLIPHNSIWLRCIIGQIDHRECAVIGNNPKHES